MPTRNIIESQLATFLYWIKERHRIHLDKERGEAPPWTDDKVMHSCYFTNPYRENDKTTVWLRENVRDPLAESDHVVFATILFRRFNLIRTGEVLLEHSLYLSYDTGTTYEVIKKEVGTPFTSGAYMMKGADGQEKLACFCQGMGDLFNNARLLENIADAGTLENAKRLIQTIPYIGPFQAYEVITDLRHTRILRDAPDIDTYCVFGPGAKRGMSRLVNGVPKGRVYDPLGLAILLLDYTREYLGDKMPPFELREIEHSLCEFDKYQRVAQGGRPKRWYDPYKRR